MSASIILAADDVRVVAQPETIRRTIIEKSKTASGVGVNKNFGILALLNIHGYRAGHAPLSGAALWTGWL
jgi:hypothetical protein